MAVDSAMSLATLLRQHHLLDPAQLDQLDPLLLRIHEPRALAKELLNRGWLTPYQINQLFQGRNLVLGGYVLLERLGEGGMGQVFKARHGKLGKVVALKLIKPEHLTNSEALRRFVREIQVAAQLSHPNVVQAYDAGQDGDRWFLVMEYVEGTNLAALVKNRGPLAIAQACDYVRQAALGLQHAHEHKLVHRDLKPSNLLLTARGDTIKLVDLGLARLTQRDGSNELSAALTQIGAVIGSPDFIAPEQARDARSADIRADLYSLGCTLFYLLTGQVVFPEGTITEKLLKHHLDAPPSVEQLRPEVPIEVSAVVQRLLAKRPEDRYQNPAELAAVLAGRLQAGVVPVASVAVAPPANGQVTTNYDPGTQTEPPALKSSPAPPPTRWWPWILGGIGVAALILVVTLGLGGRNKPPPPGPGPGTTPTVRPADPKRADHVAKILEKMGGKLKHDDTRSGRPIREIDLENCRLQADDVSLLESFPELRVLSLANTNAGDEGMPVLGRLTRLQTLLLGGTRVGNAGLASLQKLTDLEILDLSGTRVTGAGLVHLQKLSRLRELSLARTKVDAAGLAGLQGLSKLETLDLNEVPLADEGLKNLSSLKGLTQLGLRGTKITDAGLTHLQELTRLRYLNLASTRISDRGLGHLKKLTGLQWLILRNTQVSGEGIGALKAALPRARIDHGRNLEDQR